MPEAGNGAEAKDETGSEDATPAGDGLAFNGEEWRRRLAALNPWAAGLAPGDDRWLPRGLRRRVKVEDYSDAFAQARLQAALQRWHEGQEAWNTWAKAMLNLRAELEAAKLWAEPEAEKLWAEPDRDNATAEQRLFLQHASVAFDDLDLIGKIKSDADNPEPGEVNFNGFIFPGTASFHKTHFSGDARFVDVQFSGDAWFEWAQFSGAARFERAQFSGDADFDGAQFSGDAWFWRAQFSGDADFEDAQFSGDAWFRRAQFSGAALFQGAQFSGGAGFFQRAQFSGDARFERAQFSGAALFGEARFGDSEGLTSGSAVFEESIFQRSFDFERCQINYQITFARARFRGKANFRGLRSEVGFTLSNARFRRVPDFTEASFHREPRVDNVKVRPALFGTVLTFHRPGLRIEGLVGWRDLARLKTWRQLLRLKTLWQLVQYLVLFKWIERDVDAPAKFRELKHYAIKGEDSRSELAFRAEEIRSARWVTDWPWPWPARFWLGYLFGIFSNFGRSIARPLLMWTVATAVFLCIYLSAHLDYDDHLKKAGRFTAYHAAHDGSWMGWATRHLTRYSIDAQMTWTAFWEGPPPCTGGKPPDIVGLKDAVIGGAGQGTDAFVQAVRMSLANAVVFGDLGGAEGARLTYGCLFGLERLEPHNNDKPASERKPDHQRSWFTTTYLPPGVLWAMRFQKALSALFIFLFGLALRNMLKLK